jgi:opacity protein-like surface antigen
MTAGAAVADAQTTDGVGFEPPAGKGLDYVGLYAGIGLGMYGLHDVFSCPYHPAVGNNNAQGCKGDEPINFTSGRHAAINGLMGVRFSRYIAAELVASLMPGGFNTSRPQSPSPIVADSQLGQLMDIQPRIHLDYPLTSNLAVYGTAGVAWKIANHSVDQNVPINNFCKEYNPPTDPNISTSGGCKEYQVSNVNGTVADRTKMYFPVSVGLEYSLGDWGLGVNYQPPQGRGLAFYRVTLDLTFAMF